MPINMYVALQDDDKLVRFSCEPETGKLDREQEYTLSGAPSSLAISPNGRTLYVGHRTSGQISSHRIDSSTGTLTENGRVNPGTAPTYLATDRKGNFLLGHITRVLTWECIPPAMMVRWEVRISNG